MTQQEYELNELRMLGKQLDSIRLAPLKDRQEAREEMFEALSNHQGIVAERVSWLIQGSYGYGACLRAKLILGMSARANKQAALVQLVGALEWQCPERFTAEAWNRLNDAQKASLFQALETTIQETECAIS